MPLQRVGWGLVLTLLDFKIEGFDLLPDVLGWALVASGLGRLVPLPAARGPVLLARRWAWVAAAVAAPTWLLTAAQQQARAPLTETEFVVGTSAPLAAVELVVGGVAMVLVAGALGAMAGAAGAEADRRLWNTVRFWLAGSLIVASVLTMGAVVTGTESVAAASVLAVLVDLLVAVFATWMVFQHAHRSWAAAGRPRMAQSEGLVNGRALPPEDRHAGEAPR